MHRATTPWSGETDDRCWSFTIAARSLGPVGRGHCKLEASQSISRVSQSCHRHLCDFRTACSAVFFFSLIAWSRGPTFVWAPWCPVLNQRCSGHVRILSVMRTRSRTTLRSLQSFRLAALLGYGVPCQPFSPRCCFELVLRLLMVPATGSVLCITRCTAHENPLNTRKCSILPESCDLN